MKTRYIALYFLLLWSPTTFACDACGCSNSGAYFGLMPQSNKSLLGIRYNRMNFVTHPDSHVLRTEETFNVTEVYARFFPIKRVQVMAFLPYRFAQQVTTSDTKKQNGLSDVTVLVNYNVINTLMDKEKSSDFNHTLMIGGGIKLPTGRFRYDENNVTDVANANFQSGTGTTDFILNAFYTINKDQWGLAMNVSRKFNTTNSDHYRFGNQLYGTADLYRSFKVGSYSLTPNVGVYAEKSELGVRDGKKVLETGGTLLNGTVGLTLFANRWTLGVSGQKPLSQNLSTGFVQARSRALIQVGFLF
ncbi:hypothetical protein [Dyadobacter frigoris]|uniref:Transporter n=1 Tax=Dyadobacter frigoris TaxID=2576211 RepID=A0A4U6CS16_9BACT|nr:hypothetical protein [Dyadobacter frigoris]TKT85698.1 hypothetical protein FDK13_33590 [Dyadobacter frigoris]GLU55365.1 hypothetical protein Dfri01_48260 [Dyadobacter frigoris]